MSTYHSLKEISELFNIPKSTLRYWESEGIISSSRNTQNDYREYTIDDVIKISDIVFYRNLNYPVKLLKDIYKISIEEKEDFLIHSIDELTQKLVLMQKSQKELNLYLQYINEYKQLKQGSFIESEPLFDQIAQIRLGKPNNINHYLKDQSVLSIVFDFNTDLIQVYGTTDLSIGVNTLWKKNSHITKYQPCLIKVSSDQKPMIVNDIPDQKYGFIIGTYLITDKSDDYFKGWIEILDK